MDILGAIAIGTEPYQKDKAVLQNDSDKKEDDKEENVGV